jgi:ribosomal protein L11 methyltransferase
MIAFHSTKVSYVVLTVRVGEEVAETLLARLYALGALGAEIVDGTHPDPPRDLRPLEIEVRASFDGSVSKEGLLEEAKAILQRCRENFRNSLLGEPQVVSLCTEDWANQWREQFHPMKLGRFYIHPSWVAPDGQEKFPVQIDPGLAFGTGLHPTTRLCLSGLDRLLPVEGVLDVGCGTGVLALAAARAGVPRVLMVDNDPQAIHVAGENAERNRLKHCVRIECIEPECGGEVFPLVIANILSSVLVRLSSALVSKTEPGGHLLLSGLLQDEVEEVCAAYRRIGCETVGVEKMDEWAMIQMRRS